VQTVLNVLHQKGRVRRALKGRAYEYRAAESKDSVLGQAVRDLVRRMFGGSSEELVMSLVKSRQIDPDALARLSQRIKAPEGSESE
jgi:predicted transcriptional regulator